MSSQQTTRPQHIPSRPQHIKVDRTITYGLITTVLIQTASGLIWAGAAGARLSALEAQMSLTPGISERLARLEGQTVHIEQSLMRIERRLNADD